MKKINLTICLALLLTALAAPSLSVAATVNSRLHNVLVNNASYDIDKTSQNTLTDYIGVLIGVFLGLLGVIFTILLIYGGYTWMTASGNVEKATKAGRTIKVAVIGLLIIIAVYAMWVFLFARIVSI